MKDLTIEEKAKRYDEAIKKLRSLHDDYDTVSTLIDVKEELENIFPELKESEDSRIIQWIRKELEDKYVTDNIVNNEMADKALAWLEKQGKQKPVWSEEDERILKTIIISIKNMMFGDEMREIYQRIPNTNKNYYQIRIDWLKSLKDRI